MKATDCAYMAGLIDGEGSLQARHRVGPKGGVDFMVSLANTSEPMIRWIEQRWGGVVHQYPVRSPHHRQQFTWRLHGTKSAPMLKAILPYLVTKREHAEILLELARTCSSPGRAGYTDEERAAKVSIIDRLTELNRRGPIAADRKAS